MKPYTPKPPSPEERIRTDCQTFSLELHALRTRMLAAGFARTHRCMDSPLNALGWEAEHLINKAAVSADRRGRKGKGK